MSQNSEILKYLKAGNTITPLEAVQRFGCMCLAERIRDLRKKGYTILTIKASSPTSRKSYASYQLFQSELFR